MGKYLEALNLFYQLNFDNDVIEINEMLYRIEMDEKKGMNVYVDNPKDLSYTREAVKNHFFDIDLQYDHRTHYTTRSIFYS